MDQPTNLLALLLSTVHALELEVAHLRLEVAELRAELLEERLDADGWIGGTESGDDD